MKENRAKLNGHKLPVLLQKGTEVAFAYQSYETPSAVLIKPDGTIGSSTVSGAEAIRTLVANTINDDFDPPLPQAEVTKTVEVEGTTTAFAIHTAEAPVRVVVDKYGRTAKANGGAKKSLSKRAAGLKATPRAIPRPHIKYS